MQKAMAGSIFLKKTLALKENDDNSFAPPYGLRCCRKATSELGGRKKSQPYNVFHSYRCILIDMVVSLGALERTTPRDWELYVLLTFVYVVTTPFVSRARSVRDV